MEKKAKVSSLLLACFAFQDALLLQMMQQMQAMSLRMEQLQVQVNLPPAPHIDSPRADKPLTPREEQLMKETEEFKRKAKEAEQAAAAAKEAYEKEKARVRSNLYCSCHRGGCTIGAPCNCNGRNGVFVACGTHCVGCKGDPKFCKNPLTPGVKEQIPASQMTIEQLQAALAAKQQQAQIPSVFFF